jgi:hypothetical protein
MTAFSRADREVTFNSVFVVELLGPRDQQTGLNLFRTVLEPRGVRHGLYTSHIQVHEPSIFIPALWDIRDECRRRSLSPFIHFETHGSSEGLGLDLSTLVPWADLVPPLCAINGVSRMNLLVTLAVCHGLSFVKTLTPLEPSPLWGMFGPNQQVFQSDVETGFSSFYGTLLDTLNLSQAVTSLLAKVSRPDDWLLRSAEFFFAVVYGRVLDETGRPGERIDRERRLIKRLRRAARKRQGTTFPSDMRRRVRNDIADDEGHFQRYKRRFLMLDEFPDNERRFPVTREECLQVWEEQRAAYEAAD